MSTKCGTMFKKQRMLLKTWDLSRGVKRSSVGYCHQTRQRITTELCSNARKAQAFGSYKAMRLQNGRHRGTPSCGFMVFPDVARQFSAPLLSNIFRGSSPINLFSTSTSTSTIPTSMHLIAWSDRLLVSFTASPRILGNNWIRSFPLMKTDIASQAANRFARFSRK